MTSLRHSDHMQLHQSLVLAGEIPDEDGSFMSVVHETIIGVRAAISGISKKLPAFASGEEDIIKCYDDALAETAAVDPAMADILKLQRDNLLKKITEMKSIAA